MNKKKTIDDSDSLNNGFLNGDGTALYWTKIALVLL
jgi:hypothetical protein